ncbi:MAG: methylmalonyl-CoA mutase family protein, partial [Methylocystaceae bacterium]|nr:methylmalonyl-CoA mutase family protein [Methylocystaceae bacterium]
MPDGNTKMKTTKKTYKPKNPVRFVTAASLFDGHDASINIMRRILQSCGAEVIHLGHNRSVDEIVTAAIEEDAQAIAVSSYQGGHVEYFKYMIDLLKERGAGHIKVFGGGGGVIVLDEIKDLMSHGVEKIYSPEDGRKMGLEGMIQDMVKRADYAPAKDVSTPKSLAKLKKGDTSDLARIITALENDQLDTKLKQQIDDGGDKLSGKIPVIGITGTGGAGKSSLTDELVRRFRMFSKEPKIAVLAIDPTRRKTGGALLGDRIRMNANNVENVYVRSVATRDNKAEVPPSMASMINACKMTGFDVVIVETPGIGQGDAGIVPYVDFSLYVMTPEFGAASQLEKIDMLDFADVIAINKFDRNGAMDALRDVAKQVMRNREEFHAKPEDMPVIGTIASRFNDEGVTALYYEVITQLTDKKLGTLKTTLKKAPGIRHSSPKTAIVPPEKRRYLAEIADTVRGYHQEIATQSKIARERQQLRESIRMLEDAGEKGKKALKKLYKERDQALDGRCHKLLEIWPTVKENYSGDEYVVKIRDREIRTKLTYETMCGLKVPKVSLPQFVDEGEILKWLLKENVPGSFPYTAGVFAFKREGEDPT